MKSLSCLILILFVPFLSFAQSTKSANFNTTKGEPFIDGYDVVSYFKSKPLKGKRHLSYSYNNVLYLFASQENLNAFVEGPEEFIPQYGGWCAYAMGDSGDKVKIDPETYKIVDGKLYLFYNFFFNNTLNDWNKNERNLKRAADLNWENLHKDITN